MVMMVAVAMAWAAAGADGDSNSDSLTSQFLLLIQQFMDKTFFYNRKKLNTIQKCFSVIVWEWHYTIVVYSRLLLYTIEEEIL